MTFYTDHHEKYARQNLYYSDLGHNFKMGHYLECVPGLEGVLRLTFYMTLISNCGLLLCNDKLLQYSSLHLARKYCQHFYNVWTLNVFCKISINFLVSAYNICVGT